MPFSTSQGWHLVCLFMRLCSKLPLFSDCWGIHGERTLITKVLNNFNLLRDHLNIVSTATQEVLAYLKLFCFYNNNVLTRIDLIPIWKLHSIWRGFIFTYPMSLSCSPEYLVQSLSSIQLALHQGKHKWKYKWGLHFASRSHWYQNLKHDDIWFRK